MINIINNLPKRRLRDYLWAFLPYLTVRKLLNITKTELNFLFKTENISSHPYLLTIDPTNICQLKCPLCATGQNKSTRQKGKLSFRLFKKVIDELGDYLVEVHLIWWGEPFLNDEILKFVKYAHNKNVGTFISTNFSLSFKGKFIEKIVASGLDILNISLDGLTKDIYNKYRVGGNFDLVLDNIKLLVLAKKRRKKDKPLIEWQYLVNKYNEFQIPKISRFAASLGVNSVIFEELLILFGQSDRNNINIKKWLPSNPKYQPKAFSLKNNKSDNITKRKCWWLYRGVAISHDGGVSPCCYNNFIENDFGSVSGVTFSEIWNNEKYLSSRSLFKNNHKKPLTMCHLCQIAKEN
jgi:MoaA/NifB/PqqE/SkfB family radical SAM enzyme